MLNVFRDDVLKYINHFQTRESLILDEIMHLSMWLLLKNM